MTLKWRSMSPLPVMTRKKQRKHNIQKDIMKNTSCENLIDKMLPQDLRQLILSKLPPSYRFVGSVNSEYRKLHEAAHSSGNDERKTDVRAIRSVPAMELLLKEKDYRRVFGWNEVGDKIYASYIGALAGRIDFIEWAGEWNTRTCVCAAREGHLHVLRWLRDENNCVVGRVDVQSCCPKGSLELVAVGAEQRVSMG